MKMERVSLINPQVDVSGLPAWWISLGRWQRDVSPIQPYPIAFRFDFDCADASGVLEVAASHRYVLWINGRRALDGPQRGYARHRFIDVIDPGQWVRPGKNSLAALVLPPTAVAGNSMPSRLGFFCRGIIGGTQFWTDNAWKASEAVWVSSHDLVTSLPTGSQEHWDLDKEPQGWLVNPELDWSAARLLGRAGAPPWKHLLARTVPPLWRHPLEAVLVWEGKDDGSTCAPASNLSLSLQKRAITPASNCPGAAADETSLGETSNVFVFDMGKTRLIRPALRILQSGADNQIELYYANGLAEFPCVDRGFGTDEEGFCDSLRPGGKPVEWQTLQPRGCRFVTVRIGGKEPCRFQPGFEALDYPFESRVRLTCENEELLRYWNTSAETLRSCSNDVIVDTCARENSLWTFDATVSGKAAFLTFGDAALWRHCLWMIAQGIDEEGIPAAVIPAQPNFMVLFDQTMQWVVSCWEYLLCTGDNVLIQEIAGPMERFLRLCSSAVTAEDLFVPPDYSWHFVDWAPLDRRAYSLPANAALWRCCTAAARLAERRSPLAALAGDLCERLAPAIERFFEIQAGLYRDHIVPAVEIAVENGFNSTPLREVIPHSLHGNLQIAGLLDPLSERRRRILKTTAAWLAEPSAPRVKFGPGWTQILLHPFLEAGYCQEVLAFLGATYGRQLATGSPTWPETFELQKYNTAHGWGSAVNSLIVQGLLGFRPLDPHWRVIQAAPVMPCDFSYEIETGKGLFGIKKAKGQVYATAPCGAKLRRASQEIAASGKWQLLENC